MFHGVPPQELRRLNDEVQTSKDTFTLTVANHRLKTKRTFGRHDYGRAMADFREQVELIKPVLAFLPDMNVSYSIHDIAQRHISWDHRLALTENRAYTDPSYKMKGFHGLDLACPPGSRAGRRMSDNPVGYGGVSGAGPRRKTFTTSIRHATDLCLHPEYADIHGTTAKKEPRSNDRLPLLIFTLSKTSVHFDPQGASLSQWKNPARAPYLPWDRKYKKRIVWRGSGSGTSNSNQWPWRQTPRFRLVNLTSSPWGDEVEILDPNGAGRVSLPRDQAGEMLFDFHFANEHAKAVRKCQLNANPTFTSWTTRATAEPTTECSEEDGTCDTIRREFPISRDMARSEAVKYRYIADV